MFTETVTFTQHYTDQIDTRYGSKTKNTFVTDDGRRFETWKTDIAARVAASLELPLTILFEQKTNGQYTNLEIKDLVQNGSAPTQPSPAQQIVSEMNRGVTAPAPQAQPSVSQKEKEVSIQRQSAVKSALQAFEIAGIDPITNSSELLEYADTVLFDYFQNGLRAPVESEA